MPRQNMLAFVQNRLGLAVFACVTIVSSGLDVHAQQPTPDQLEFFENQIRPLLARHCYECHSSRAEKLQAGLRLDSRSAIVEGGDSGPAIVAGAPDESLLVQAVRYESFEMPPRNKLPDESIDKLTRWVQMGAPWPDRQVADTASRGDSLDGNRQSDNHWCWLPIRPVSPPTVIGAEWATNPVDSFILARLEDAGLIPAQPADRRTLLRRVYFDLIGLPPTPDEVHSFLSDTSTGAYEQVVDRLLDSKHFGEKWARHWMDLVRYAETLGHEFDYPLHHAYRYRDYLIRALNADVPYNQFVQEHIAGDLLDPPRWHPTEDYNESVIGTGFWFLGEAVHAPTDVRGDEADRINNQIDVFSKTFLALTVACARCHDHKFDPISAQDYYALAGFLQSSRRQEALLDPGGTIHRISEELEELRSRGTDALRDHLAGQVMDADRVAAYLRAALDKGLSEPGVPEASGLDPRMLKRWTTALADVATESPAHPLHAWRELVDGNGDGEAHGDFRERRDAAFARVSRLKEQSEEDLARTVLFDDFEDGNLDGWYVTGQAFDDKPTVSVQWDSMSRGSATVARPGVAHSGQSSKKLRGVLRSPTFELTHRQIHYRINSQAAQIRLIVDGYTMDIFNALLFADLTLEKVDTGGQFQWIAQHRDLDHYLGHRAHIEIIDHGDGFAAVDEIRFSDEGPPSDPPHPFNLSVLIDPEVSSADGLARKYAELLSDTIRRMRNEPLTADDIAVVNWLLAHELIPKPARIGEIASAMDELERELPAPIHAIALADGDGEDERVHIRGSHKNLGQIAQRRVLPAIAGENQPRIERGSGRLQLAQRITDSRNPLAARVMINRIWHHLFGRGIVPTVDDFGRMGQPPSHPELLNWLTQDFVQRGWSIKQAIRQIVLSSTYRMSSQPASDMAEIARVDPDNQLLHRAPIRRLSAEAIRDTMLAVSGRLDRTMFGPSVAVHLTPFMEGRGRPQEGPMDGNGRRSLYVEVRRNFLSPMMLAFDTPIPFSSMGRRSVSNVPAQSLILMNDPFVTQQAELWAKSLLSNTSHSTEERVAHAFESAFAHPPTDRQLARAISFLRTQAELSGCEEDDPGVWKDLCHTLMNMKEFIYVR